MISYDSFFSEIGKNYSMHPLHILVLKIVSFEFKVDQNWKAWEDFVKLLNFISSSKYSHVLNFFKILVSVCRPPLRLIDWACGEPQQLCRTDSNVAVAVRSQEVSTLKGKNNCVFDTHQVWLYEKHKVTLS